tara:strand:- start:123 stop:452 length:330 start_codon:yes stop_codon:yes gene_type:complete
LGLVVLAQQQIKVAQMVKTACLVQSPLLEAVGVAHDLLVQAMVDRVVEWDTMVLVSQTPVKVLLVKVMMGDRVIRYPFKGVEAVVVRLRMVRKVIQQMEVMVATGYLHQ